jgi:hypothetical protein
MRAIYGYARVSTDAQDLGNQVAQLKAAKCVVNFREKISGATADRPQLKKLMAKLSAGDVVIIPAVDRLSRDTTDLLVIARDMQRTGAGLRSLGISAALQVAFTFLCGVVHSGRPSQGGGLIPEFLNDSATYAVPAVSSRQHNGHVLATPPQ